jgi:hypothetical protein
MNQCAPQCLTFAPYIAGPLQPISVAEGQPIAPVVITIYGTLPFGVSICGNPTFPVTIQAVISGIQLVGNLLTVNFATPGAGDAGVYSVQLCITNQFCCEDLQVPISVTVTP